MQTLRTGLVVLALSLSLLHCGGQVTRFDTDAPSDATVATDAIAPDVLTVNTDPTPSCAAVRASCGPAPQMVVRGHATGLVGVDGAVVEFGVRYLLAAGQGLTAARGLAAARGSVVAGAFEVCLCLPDGANDYPLIAAMIHSAGTAMPTSGDVLRAQVSQRYATLGDEDFSGALTSTPGAIEAAVALADLTNRTGAVTVHGLDTTVEGAHVFAALVATERPVAAEIATANVTHGQFQVAWDAPGHAWDDESLFLLLDRNANGHCDDGDDGAIVPLNGRTDLDGIGGNWLQGAALMPVCTGLQIETPRGF